MSEWLHSAFYRDENERFYASLYRSRSLNDTSCTSSRSQASPKTPPSLAPLDLPPAAWSAPSSYLSNDGRSLAFHGNGDTYAPLLSPTTSAAYHTLPSFAPSTQQHAVPSPPRYLDPSLIANAAVYRLSSSPPKRSHDSQSQRKSTTRTIIDTKQKAALENLYSAVRYPSEAEIVDFSHDHELSIKAIKKREVSRARSEERGKETSSLWIV